MQETIKNPLRFLKGILAVLMLAMAFALPNTAQAAPGDIGGIVYNDVNNNGSYNVVPVAIDFPVAGAKVQLLSSSNAVLAETTTGADGSYLFAGRTVGSYKVQISLAPTGYVSVGEVKTLTLLSGGESTTNYLALKGQGGSISGLVFLDNQLDDAGYNAGDTLLKNVYVYLKSGGNTIATFPSMSDGTNDGFYQFQNLPPGTYTVEIDASPAGVLWTTSDGNNNAPVKTISASLSGGAAKTGTYFKFRKNNLSGIDGLVIVDIQDDQTDLMYTPAGDLLMAGATVDLKYPGGGVVATATTGADGKYQFKPVPMGTYVLQVTIPSDYNLAGSKDGRGNNKINVVVNDETSPFTQNYFYGTGKNGITGFIFDDTDYSLPEGNNGPGTGDIRYGGVTVRVYKDGSATPLLTQKTKSDGSYSFKGLPVGTYVVEMDPASASLPAPGYEFQDHTGSKWLVGGGDTTIPDTVVTSMTDLLPHRNFWYIKSGAVGSNNYHTVPFLGATATTVQPGYVNTYTYNNVAVGGYALPVQIQLYQLDKTTPVGAPQLLPNYGQASLFNYISAPSRGRYYLGFVNSSIPAGYTPRQAFYYAPMGRPAFEGYFYFDGDTTTGGNFLNSGVKGVIFWDKNGNNANNPDAGETQLNKVQLGLWDESGVRIATGATNSDGTYHFANLAKGKYTIKVTSLAYSEYDGILTYAGDSDGTYDGALNVDLTGGPVTSQNIWLKKNDPYYIKGTVYVDTVDDSKITLNDMYRGYLATDMRLEGAIVELLDSTNAVVNTFTTGIDGKYAFNGLTAGMYQVRVSSSSGEGIGYSARLAALPMTQTADRTVDEVYPDINFLLAGKSGVYGTGFYDFNGDGLFSPGEQAMFIQLYLRKDSPTGRILDVRQYGQSNDFVFANLGPGTYYITVDSTISPYVYQNTQGTTPASEMKFVVTTATTEPFKNNWFYTSYGYWFGVGIDVINGSILSDRNHNGTIQNDGSLTADAKISAAAGATVSLYRTHVYRDTSGAAAAVQTTTVQPDGTFSFPGVLDRGRGSFLIKVDGMPGGYEVINDADGTSAPAETILGPAIGTIQLNNVSGTRITIANQDFLYKRSPENVVSGRVYYDQNYDDAYTTPPDTGMNGVIVELLDSSNTVIAAQTVADDGTYAFGSMDDGTYTLRVRPSSILPEYRPGAGSPATLSFTTAAGMTTADQKFWYIKDGIAGFAGQVMLDLNGNALPDAQADVPMEGWTVKLTNTATSATYTTTVSAQGAYMFTDIGIGNYKIELVLPAGYGVFKTVQGVTNSNIMNVTMGDPPTMKTGYYFLVAGDTNQGPTIPNIVPSGIGGMTYKGLAYTATPAAADLLPGVLVGLFDSTGTKFIGSVQTDSAGKYQFFNLKSGTYIVKVLENPPSSAPAGDVDGTTPAGTLKVNAPLNNGIFRQDVWFAAISEKGIEGAVYYDVLRDSLTASSGTVNANDVPLAGVELELFSGTGGSAVTTGMTVTTGTDGTYSFPNLVYGSSVNYIVKIKTLPVGYVAYGTSTKGTTAPLSEIEVLALPQAGVTNKIFFTTGAYSIGDLVWKDVDGSNTYNAGDIGISGVQVKLTWAGTDGILGNADDVAFPTAATTSASGAYSFSYLAPGIYSVSIDNAAAANVTALSGLQLIPDTLLTGNVNPQTKTISNGNIADADFGYRTLGSIKGKVVYDNNADGAYVNPPDAPVVGQVVTLTKPDSTTVTATTDATGEYTFSSLPYGVYTITTTVPTNYVFSFDADDPVTGTKAGTPNSISVTLNAAGFNPIDKNFGYKGSTGVSGIVSIDVDANGAKNIPADIGMSGVKVAIYPAGGSTKLLEVTTDSAGAYNFASVPLGNWDVKVDTTTIPAGYTFSYDADGATTGNGAVGITIAGGDLSKPNIDFGYKGNGAISGSIFKDLNGDGVFAGADVKVGAGLKITLSGGAGFVSRDVYTDALGNYTISGLGAYSGYKITVDNTNTTLLGGYTVPSVDPVNGTTNPTLANVPMPIAAPVGGVFAPMINKDFGLMGAAKIKGRVFQDNDDDGLYVGAPKDAPLSGVAVQLWLSGSQIATSTTDANGQYSLPAMSSTAYEVRIDTATLPVGIKASFDYDDVFSANALPATPNRAAITTPVSGDALDTNFGYINSGSFQGTVRKDEMAPLNIFNAADSGIAGVEVHLLAVDGVTPINTIGGTPIVTTTDSAGVFQLRNLDSTLAYKVETHFGASAIGALTTMEPTYDSDSGPNGVGGAVNYIAGTHIVCVPSVVSPAPISDPTSLYLAYSDSMGDILISKRAAKGSAKIGEIVPYTIKIVNRGTSGEVKGLVVQDMIPAGFKYVDGSARMDGVKIADPTGGRPLNFPAFDLGSSSGNTTTPSEHTLTYFLIVGAGVTPGDYTNTAVVLKENTGKVASNYSSATVKITGDPLFDDSLIFGKVFIDANSNGSQDNGEQGLGGVKLVTGRGEVITTDSEGRYHLADVSGGRWERGANFILKLDTRSLPQGAKVISDNPIVVRLSPGLPSRVNFGIQLPTEKMSEVIEKAKVVRKAEVDQKEQELVTHKRLSIQGVNFDFDKDVILPEFKSTLDQVAEILKKHPEWKIGIEGHTDSLGSEEYNQELSQRRANAVRSYLITKGIPASQLVESVGHGKNQPIGDNETSEGRYLNRRVDFVVKE